MQMDEAQPFTVPVDPVASGKPVSIYCYVIYECIAKLSFNNHMLWVESMLVIVVGLGSTFGSSLS